jgi:hypothetical protein
LPKLLSEDQKQERVWICSVVIAAVPHWSKSMLDSIITIDEPKVCHHTPGTKKEPKVDPQRSGVGGVPLKALVHAKKT